MSLRQSFINEHYKIKDFLKYCHFNTCLLLDIDDTLVTQVFGDPWFENLLQNAATKTQGKAVADVIAIYHAIQNITEMNPIEKKTIFLIKALQDIGLPVIALTSRGVPIIPSTLRQLQKIGIHFDRQWGKNEFDLEVDGKKELSIFKDGIIFCTGYDKGKCLSAFLNKTAFFPNHVVMIDDKSKHLEAVKQTVQAYGGTFQGVRYSHMDEVAKQFDLERAQRNLEKLKPKLAIEDQERLNKLNRIIFSNKFFKPGVEETFVDSSFETAYRSP